MIIFTNCTNIFVFYFLENSVFLVYLLISYVAEKKRFQIKVKLQNTDINAQKKTKDATRKRVERAKKKKLTETPEEKAVRLQKRNTRQRRERKNQSCIQQYIHLCHTRL